MKNINATLLSLEEYNNILKEITRHGAWIESSGCEWFYVSNEICNYDDKEYVEMVSKKLGINARHIIVDIFENKVVLY